jgi:hypothetical protein
VCTGTSQVGSVSGYTYAGNKSMADVVLDLRDTTGRVLATTASDHSGWYHFGQLKHGKYQISVWPPLGYTADPEQRELLVLSDIEDINFYLERSNSNGWWRSRGYWLHQVRAFLYGKGNAQETIEEMCGYLERIRLYFNANAEYPIHGFYVNPDADCDQRLMDLEDVLSFRGKLVADQKAQAHFAVLLLNIASGRLSADETVAGSGPEGAAAKNQPTSSAGMSVDIFQAVTYCDMLLTDNDPSNDERAGDIARLITDGEPVPDGWIDPETPVIEYLTPTDVSDGGTTTLPTGYQLSQNYPNPFNPTTTIDYALAERTKIQLIVYNLLGQPVKVLVDATQPAGTYSAVWDGTDRNGGQAASGVYFYRLIAGDNVLTKKMMLLK